MGKYDRTVKDLIIELKKFSEKETSSLAINVHSLLRTSTPKDTSWAANNWIPQIGSPFTSTVGSRENPTEGISTAAQATSSLASSYKFSKGSIFITNNVPYIIPLNNGHSGQAPAGFVQFSLLIAIQDAVRGSTRSFAIV